MTEHLKEGSPSKKPKGLKLDEVGQRVLEDVREYDENRREWMRKRRDYLSHWNEYVAPGRKGAWKESSDLHMPLTMSVAKALHSRLVQALLNADPPFVVLPREQNDADKVEIIDKLMSWTLKDYINYREGIFREVDTWIWDCVESGIGVAKLRWDRVIRKFLDVEERQRVVASELVVGENESPLMRTETEIEEVEVEREEIQFDGPIFETIAPEDFYMDSSARSIDDSPSIIHRIRMTKSDLLERANRGDFNKKEVEEILKGDAKENSDVAGWERNEYKERMDRQIGVEDKRELFTIYEWYGKYDVDGDSIDEEVVFWVDAEFGKVLRWTYLDRILKNGKRPFYKIDLIPRPRKAYSIGLVELLYPLNKELDAIHNQRVDFGTITNIPFGFYRASSGLKPENIKLEPGILIPLDNPQGDVFFPSRPNATIWGFQEESSLIDFAQRLSSISDLNLGRPVSQQVGAARTAFGTAAVLQEGNIQIDLVIRRLIEGWEKVLDGILLLLQEKLPAGVVLRVTGQNDNLIFKPLISRREIAGKFDFDVRGNSLTLNKALQQQKMLQMGQFIVNPVPLQIGIVGPSEIYEYLIDLGKSMEISRIKNYYRKPPEAVLPISPIDAIGRMMQGDEVPVSLVDNHAQNLEVVQEFINSDEFGFVDPAFKGLFAKYIKDNERALSLLAQVGSMAQAMSGMNVPAAVPGASSEANIGSQNEELGLNIKVPGQSEEGGGETLNDLISSFRK